MRSWMVLAGLLLLPASGQAASVLEGVRGSGVLHCAAVARPGLAFPGADGAWRGLEVELCRAVAVAAAGPAARVEFRGLYAPGSFAAVRRGDDELVFLTGPEVIDHGMAGAVRPGAPVFDLVEQVLVPASLAATGVGDLQGRKVCFEPGTQADRDADALVASRGLRLFHSPFFEAEEMLDAFNVGRCDAIVGEAPALAALSFSVDKEKQPVRLLPEVLSAEPVLAATPAGADDAWAETVRAVLRTVIAGEPVRQGAAAGLDAGWQARVLGQVGPYSRLFRTTLGEDSLLHLAHGAVPMAR